MPRLALIAAAAVAAALGLASTASAATGPVAAPAPASASLSAMQTGTINPDTLQLTSGAPVPLVVSTLQPAPNSAKLVIAPPQASETSETDIDARNDTFDRVMDVLREMQAMRDRTIRGMA